MEGRTPTKGAEPSEHLSEAHFAVPVHWTRELWCLHDQPLAQNLQPWGLQSFPGQSYCALRLPPLGSLWPVHVHFHVIPCMPADLEPPVQQPVWLA